MKHEKTLSLKTRLNEAQARIFKMADYCRANSADSSQVFELLINLTNRMENVSRKILIHVLASENSNNFLDDFLTSREVVTFIDLIQKLENELESFIKNKRGQLENPEISKVLKNLDSKIGSSFKRYGSI